MYKDSDKLGLRHIALLLQMMKIMSPSNPHTERQVKAMNNIKTVPRTNLSQAKVNNLFKVATGALTGEEYDPQAAIDHWMDLSKQGDKVKDGKIHLQCGQEVPNIFRLKSAYKTRTGTTKASIVVSETTSTELMKKKLLKRR